jgi:uncharacterized protein (DUF39 family)
MASFKVKKTYKEINEKIKKGKAVVVTAEEIIDIVKKKGKQRAAREVDVVTTGTFSPMCSSGAIVNFGQTSPTIKAAKVWLNGVPAYAGLAAVDIYIGATEPAADDPLNKVYPGEFKYGGGHVIQDLVAGKPVELRVEAYGTDCYPRKKLEKNVIIDDFPNAILCNPRNAYQNYNCAVNLSDKTIYTYMGPLKPRCGNANYATAGQLSPLLNDPYFKTIGIGTRIFLGGAQGFVVWHGTQHNPHVPRTRKGIPRRPSGALFVMGNLKEMSPKWLVGVSILGYGCSLAVGIGVAIPILNEEIVGYTAVSDKDIYTEIIDYSHHYAHGTYKSYGKVNYEELRSGSIVFKGQEIPAIPLSSYKRAKEISQILKTWIMKGEFLLTEPQQLLPSA